MTSYCIEPDWADPMRAMSVLREVPPTALALDRVHLNLTGHMAITQAFLKRWSILGELGVHFPSKYPSIC